MAAAPEAVTFRLWPPVAIGAPLLAGWIATRSWGDPVDLGGWRVPVGCALVLGFGAWGVALLAPTFWGLVLFPAAVLLVLWGAILPEERFLRERFGASYDGYRQRVRRWL